MGLLATVRDRPVAAREQLDAGRCPPLPHAVVVQSQRVVRVWQFSDSLVAERSAVAGLVTIPLGSAGAHAERALEELHLEQHEILCDLFLAGHVGDAGQREHGVRPPGGQER